MISDVDQPSTFNLQPSTGGCVAVPLLFAIPPTPPDESTFSSLPHELRLDVLNILARLRQIHESGNIQKESERIAAGLKVLLNGQRGTSAATLRRQYYAYTKYGVKDTYGNLKYHRGDWRCIVDWAKAGPRARKAATESLPAPFLEFWRTLCEKHQRVTSEAYRELIQIWQTGFDFQRNRIKQIPGYSTTQPSTSNLQPSTVAAGWPSADPSTGRPKGWTDRNLYRYAPDALERTSARIGIQAASAVGLKLRSTRCGLLPLEHVELDDHEVNAKINFPGQLRSLRPRGFGAADVLCSHLISFVSKPTFWDEEEQAKKALTETDFMWFVIAFLTHTGFRTDTGTILHGEHGTSTLRKELADRLHNLTGGKVSFVMGGRFHKTAHGGQLFAPSGGNFRFKPIIEGYWRMLDDRLDSIPGQVGKDRNHAPEELERSDAYVQKLLKASAAMDPDRAAELIIPRLTWEEYTQAVHEKIAAINSATEHEIEGWQKLGFVVKEFRQSPQAIEWHPLTSLPSFPSVNSDSDLVARISSNDQLYRVRQMSRAEAFAFSIRKSQIGIRKLSPSLIPALVGPRNALRKGEPLTVRNGIFEFDDWRISSDPLVFIAQDDTGARLREGEKYICYVNPMAPAQLIACDKDHRVISICPPMPTPAMNDAHAIQQSMGLQNSWYARALAPQRARHAPDAAALAFMRRHNAAILEGKPTQADQQRARALRKAALSNESLLSAPSDVMADSEISNLKSEIPVSGDFNPEDLL